MPAFHSLKPPVFEILTFATLLLLTWSAALGIAGNEALPPHGQIFAYLLLFVVAFVLGEITSLVGLPPLLGMLIGGFVLTNIESLHLKLHSRTSAVLRSLALTIILLRAGLGLDPKVLKRLSGVCFRLACTPCIVETLTCGLMSYLVLDLPVAWGLLLGFVLAAVSPAVVVPGMIQLQEKKLGTDKGIPTLIIAAASVDDVLAITGFGVVLGLVMSSHTSLLFQIVKGPLEALLGIGVGVASGFFLWIFPFGSNEEVAMRQRFIALLLFGVSTLFVAQQLDWASSGPLAVLCLAFVASLKWREFSYELAAEKTLKIFWIFAQPFLFGLIGTEVKLATIDPDLILLAVLTLAVGLLMRCSASALVVWGADLNKKEKLFIALAW